MAALLNELLRDVGALARSVHSISDIRFRGLSLQKGQFIFLTRICEYPGINLVDLSELLRVDKTTTTKAVQKLCREGYAQKQRDPLDQRMWRLVPLPRALKTYPQIIGEENRNIECCMAGFSAEEQAEALRLLARMRQNIEARWKMVKKG